MSKQSYEIPSHGALHVAEVARLADVTPATVRYYTRMKLLNPKRDPDNDYRCFSLSDVRRVEFIRQAQSLGLTIGDIKSVLATVDDGDAPCNQVKSLVAERLLCVQEQIADLLATESRINEAVEAWRDMNTVTRQNGEFCPLIERVDVANCHEPSAPRRQTQRRPVHEARHCPPQVGDTDGLALA